MPQVKAAKKDLRKNSRRRVVNDRWRRKLREALNSVRDAISDGNQKQAESAYAKAQGTIDQAARHNILHPNKAARKKSRIQQAIAKL